MTEAPDLDQPAAGPLLAGTPAGLLQVVFESLRHGIALFDAAGRLVAANRLAGTLTGLPGERFSIGRTARSLIEEQAALGEFGSGEAAAAILAQAISLDRSKPGRYVRTRPDGTVVEVTSDPTPDGGFVVAYTDITARARAEAAMQDQAATLRATLDTLRHGVAVFGPDRRLRVANALAEELAGHPPGTLRPGRGFDELVTELLETAELTYPEAHRIGRAALTADRSKPQAHTRNKPDGRVLEVRSNPTPDGGFVIAFTDITALARAEAAARDRAEMLATALESMRHGCLIYGPDDRLLAANALAATGSGLAPEDLVPGRSRAGLLARQQARGMLGEGPAGTAMLLKLLARDRRQPHQDHRILADGRVIEVVSVPTPTGGSVVTYTDITALAAAEAAARERAGLLQTMQDTMRHGIALFGRDQRLVIANPLAAGLAGLHPDELRPGLIAADIARIQRDRGVFGSGPAAAAETNRVCRRDRTRPHQVRRAMPDGRIVDSASDPTPDGGFVITWTDVTAVVRAEAAADQRAATLQAMIENMRHGVALFSADHRLMAANRLLQELGGFPADALRQGRRYEELVAEQVAGAITGDPALDRAYAAQALETDRSRPTRYVRPSHDGRMLEVTSDPMPDGGFVIGVSDITALARAEAEARQRARTQAVMLDTIRHGIALYGPDHRLIAVNRLSGAINGVTPTQFGPGTPYEDVVRFQFASGGLGPDPAAEMERLLRIDRTRPQHYQRRTGDGRLIDVHSDPTPDGGFAITFTDITALAAAEAAAASRAAMLQAALDHMRHGIMLFGPDRRLLDSNPLAGEIGGFSPAELRPGTLLDDQIRWQHANGLYGTGPAAEATMHRLLELDRSKPAWRRRAAPDGRVIEVFTDPTADGGFVLSFTDITARDRAQAEARQRAATLQVTLDSVRHGIAMYGPDRRLVVANRLAGPSHNLPELEHRTGALFDDLVEEQRAGGMFGAEPGATQIAAEIRRRDHSRPHRYQRRMTSGRMLDVASVPTPDGGFVITVTDITELTEARAEAAARASVMQVMLDNIRHGIRYFGPDQRLIAYNHLVDDLTGNPRDASKLGITYDELLQAQVVRGTFGDAETTAAVLRMGRTLNQGKPARYVRRTPDGRILEVSSNPTPDGGFIVTHTDATELLQAQAAAADRAALLQVMLDSMRHGIALFDRDHRLVTANRLTADFNGIPAGSLRPGRPAAELVAEAVAADMETVDATGDPVPNDYRQPLRRIRDRPDGRVIEVFTDPTPDGGFVATFSDITALTRAEAAASERAGILQVMLDNIRHGISYYGADRRVIAANALASEFGGHPPGALRPGRALDELIEEQRRLGALGGDVEALVRLAREMDRSRPARYIRPTPDGRILEVTSDPTPGGGFVVTASDITALANAEQAAQHRADILQAMLDNSRQGIILFDAAGKVVAANGMAAGLNGLPAASLQPGRSIQALIEEQAQAGYLTPQLRAEALALVPQDRPWPVPYMRQRSRGDGRIIEITTDRAGEAGYIRSYRDISDEQRARAELERARDAAEAANKAKSRFLATMSHELRTPLNAVIGFSEAFMFDQDPVRGREYVQSIHEAGRHLLSLIDDVLDVTRSETTGFAITEGKVDLAALAEGAVRVMQATAGTAGVAVQAALPPGLPLVRADDVRLRQVLLNLLSNAVKFTPAGGSVTLGAEIEPAGDLVVRVTDTGIGLAEADIPRAFEAFTQLDSSLSRRFPGSGLGLYLSRALAEAQGASLGLESRPGAGTTAVLRFPKARLLADPATCPIGRQAE